MRLAEHVLPTWDVEVIRDPGAAVAGDAAGLVLDFQMQLAGMIGKPRDQKLHVHVTTERPSGLRADCRFRGRDAGPGRPGPGGRRSDPAAARRGVRPATVRAAGREHPAQVEAYGVDLDDLRQVFPGF